MPDSSYVQFIASDPANIATPAAGRVNFFADSTNSNVPSYKDSAGVTHAMLVSAVMTTLVDAATVVWTVTNKAEDLAQLTIAGARTLSIVGAAAGFRGVVHITESGAGRTLALPAGSKVANNGVGAIALTGVNGGKSKWTVSYDGTNYWWEYGVTYS